MQISCCWLGNRTNEDGTDCWSLIPDSARVLHVDIDPQEIGRNYEAVRLFGDARATPDALAIALGNHTTDRVAIGRRVADAWLRGHESTLLHPGHSRSRLYGYAQRRI